MSTIAAQIRLQPANEIPASYFNGTLTFQVDARTRSVRVVGKIVKDGIQHSSKNTTIAGAIAGLVIGSFVAGPPTGAAAAKVALAGGAVGGIAGLALDTAIYVYKVDSLESKTSELRKTAATICKLIIEKKMEELHEQEPSDGEHPIGIEDPVTCELMIEPINLNCGQPVPHVMDLMSVSELIQTSRNQGTEPKCPTCRATLVQNNFTYHLETKLAIQRVVTEVLEYLIKVKLRDPTVINEAHREKNQRNLLQQSGQIIEQVKSRSLSGAQAYILSFIIQQYVETWNNKMAELDTTITEKLRTARKQKQITHQEYIEKTREALDWYGASIIQTKTGD